MKKEIRIEDGDKFVALKPYAKGLTFDLKIDFPHPAIKASPQEIEYQLHPTTYIKRIARARTFGFVSDLEKLHTNGLALGASLKNAVSLDKEKIVNPEGLRFADEFVKHKLLDAIGDLYIAGPIHAAYQAFKPSHALNNRLIRELLANKRAWQWVE